MSKAKLEHRWQLKHDALWAETVALRGARDHLREELKQANAIITDLRETLRKIRTEK